MNIIDKIEQAYQKKGLPELRAGDTVRVFVKIKEGDKERLQAYQGVVLKKNGGGCKETITVRKVSYGVGVERVFPLHSPSIDRIEVVQRGKVRRSRLYYLRNLSGRAARIESREHVKKIPSTTSIEDDTDEEDIVASSDEIESKNTQAAASSTEL